MYSLDNLVNAMTLAGSVPVKVPLLTSLLVEST
jgi:hypothetical protein